MGNKKEWRTDRCYNVDEPQEHCAGVKEARQKCSHIKHDSIYVEYPKYVNLQGQEADQWLLGAWEMGSEGLLN